jgi:hypothetical protein
MLSGIGCGGNGGGSVDAVLIHPHGVFLVYSEHMIMQPVANKTQ